METIIHQCVKCLNRFYRNDMVLCDTSDYICKDCLKKLPRCRDCGTLILFPHHKINNDFICDECRKDYCSCEHCNNLIPKTDIVYCEYYDEDEKEFDGKEVCSDCYFRIKQMHEHNYKPKTVFKGEDNRKTNLHVGIELEINADTRNNLHKFLDDFNNSKNNDFYMKEDGSLTYRGVEIVSQPMTLDYLYQSWKHIFDSMKTYSMNDISNSGLHIHLDRDYLTPRTIQNLDYILNNYCSYFVNVAGRDYVNDNWCETIRKPYWGEQYGDSRYVAVNLLNDNTVEIRICKSTTDFQKFIYRIMNILALVEYCKKHTFDFIVHSSEERFNRIFVKFFKKFLSDFYNENK